MTVSSCAVAGPLLRLTLGKTAMHCNVSRFYTDTPGAETVWAHGQQWTQLSDLGVVLFYLDRSVYCCCVPALGKSNQCPVIEVAAGRYGVLQAMSA